MHSKDKTAEELCEAWNLNEYDPLMIDIKSALAEAYMKGVLDGGMDEDLHEEALDLFREKTSTE